MQEVKEQLVLIKEDYDIIMTLLKQGSRLNTFNWQDAQELLEELRKARIVKKEELPDDVVRLNSIVTIKDDQANKTMVVKVVTPDNADIRQRKISVLSPVGTALLGFRKGKNIQWDVPAGKKAFTILEVVNPVHHPAEAQEDRALH